MIFLVDFVSRGVVELLIEYSRSVPTSAPGRCGMIPRSYKFNHFLRSAVTNSAICLAS